MAVYINYDKNHYKHEIWLRIQKGLLTGAGKPFSFTIDVATEWIKYERWSRDFFPKMWKKKDTRRSKNKDNFDKACRELPSTIAVSSQYKCFLDERQTEAYGFALVENGYTITVNVSEAYATEYYKPYALAALPFRNKLLSNHKELIKKIAGFEDSHYFLSKTVWFSPGSSESTLKRFYVTPTGVGTSSKLDVDSHGNYYADFGMSNLSDISECYGFALAIIEIYRPEWEKYGIPNIEIAIEDRFGVSAILVEYKVIRGDSPLKPW